MEGLHAPGCPTSLGAPRQTAAHFQRYGNEKWVVIRREDPAGYVSSCTAKLGGTAELFGPCIRDWMALFDFRVIFEQIL